LDYVAFYNNKMVGNIIYAKSKVKKNNLELNIFI